MILSIYNNNNKKKKKIERLYGREKVIFKDSGD